MTYNHKLPEVKLRSVLLNQWMQRNPIIRQKRSKPFKTTLSRSLGFHPFRLQGDSRLLQGVKQASVLTPCRCEGSMMPQIKVAKMSGAPCCVTFIMTSIAQSSFEGAPKHWDIHMLLTLRGSAPVLLLAISFRQNPFCVCVLSTFFFPVNDFYLHPKLLTSTHHLILLN